jgi:hypothetical protein
MCEKESAKIYLVENVNNAVNCLILRKKRGYILVLC